jgi:hypothetical protein
MVARITEAELARLQAHASPHCRIAVSGQVAPAPAPRKLAPPRREADPRERAPLRVKPKLAPVLAPLPLRIAANIVAGVGTAAVVIVVSFAITIATVGTILALV